MSLFETLRKWVNRMLHWLGYFDLCHWPWIFKVKLYLGNGRPDCHGTKGMGVNRMPWCKRQPLCDLEAEETVRDRGNLRCWRFRRLILVIIIITVRCCYNVDNFVTNIHNRHPIIAHPSGRDMGCLFVDPASDWYSASISIIAYAISYDIGLRYNGTLLYYYYYHYFFQSPNFRYFISCKIGKKKTDLDKWKKLFFFSFV